ncbi:MAG: UMP kinase, partial [Rhabdochlamydiaceae bacterium]
VSGEALLGNEKFGIDSKAVLNLAQQIYEIQKLPTQVGVVIGGGNIIRGSQAKVLDIPREKADQMGMLATTINGTMLAEALESLGCNAVVVGAFPCGTFIPEGSGDETLELLQNGVVVIFVGGTGHPYFTTDTAAALRACEIKADVLIKATKVDGIFDKNPIKHPKAKRLDTVTYNDVLCHELNVMDAAAVALCRDNNIPIHVLNIFKKGALKSATLEQSGGSLVIGIKYD